MPVAQILRLNALDNLLALANQFIKLLVAADVVATGEYSEFWVHLYNHACAVSLYFQGDDREERRQKALKLFPQEEYEYELRESPKFSNIVFPVLDKGKICFASVGH